MQPHPLPTRDNRPDTADPNGRVSQHMREAFRAEERAGQALAARARIVVLLVAALLLAMLEPAPDLYFYEAVVLALALLGAAQHRFARSGRRRWPGFVFVVADVAVIVCGLTFVPAVLYDGAPQLVLRTAPVAYLFLLMAYVAVSYSPALMVWAGVVAAAAWAAGVAWLVRLPGTTLAAPTTADRYTAILQPGFIDLRFRIEEIVALLLCAAILAFVVRRSRRLVIREATAARQRANLARYFSPTLVDELAGRDEPLGPVRRQNVAVLFADIVGFTTFAESRPPEEVLSMLREFHNRMEQQVFFHGGTLEKFIGDALLATFGVPRSGGHDAADALTCAYAMHASLQQWNQERSASGEAALRLGVGAHFGPAVLGDIGSARNMAFACVGDTINAASRLQVLTRTLDCDVVVSDALVAEARREGTPAALLESLADGGLQALRGRGEPIRVWCALNTRAAAMSGAHTGSVPSGVA